MYPPQWFSTNEPFQPLEPEGELAEGEGSLVTQATAPQAGQVPISLNCALYS